ncbi:MAG: tetratricopeptide repeat protein [Nitrospina sp.]|nr:tetratricopeptide repeat protein [Nitrospina sp.]
MYQIRKILPKLCAWGLLLAGLAGCQNFDRTVEKTRQWVAPDRKPQIQSSLIGYRPVAQLARDNLEYARQQYLLQNFNVAEYYLKKTLVQNPDEADALYLLPWTHFFQKRYEMALVGFSRIHSQSHRDSHPLIGMGWCYFAMQYYEEALDAFERAGHFAPGTYQVAKGRGMALLALSRIEEAAAELETIFTRDEIHSLQEEWKSLASSGKRPEMIPHGDDHLSVFSLSQEVPRYPALLYPLEEPIDHPPLREAWTWYRKGLYKRALASFEGLDTPYRNTLDGQNGLAWSLYSSGKLEEAQTVFQKILDRHPSFLGAVEGQQTIDRDLKAKADIARRYYDLGKYRLAELKYDDLRNDYWKWAHPRAMLGTIALVENREEEAEELFEDALRRDPEDPVALEGLDQLERRNAKPVFEGNRAFRKKDFQSASYHYWDYIDSRGPVEQLDSHLANAYNGLAWSQLEKGLNDLAVENFDRLQHLEEFEYDVASGKGLAYYHAGVYHSAVEHLARAELMRYGDVRVSEALDWSVLGAYSPAKAETWFLQRLHQHPRQASTYMTLGWVYYHNGNPDLGVEYFLKSISLKPQLALSDEFVDMLKRERFGWEIYNRMAWEYYHRHEYDTARRLFQAALTRQPENSDSLAGLGYAWYRLGDLNLAARFLMESLRQNAHPLPVEEVLTGEETTSPVMVQTNPRTKLGRVFLEKGDFASALQHFTRARLKHPDWPEINDGLGWAYLGQGRLEEARASFDKAIQFQPLHSQAKQGLRQIKAKRASKNL